MRGAGRRRAEQGGLRLAQSSQPRPQHPAGAPEMVAERAKAGWGCTLWPGGGREPRGCCLGLSCEGTRRGFGQPARKERSGGPGYDSNNAVYLVLGVRAWVWLRSKQLFEVSQPREEQSYEAGVPSVLTARIRSLQPEGEVTRRGPQSGEGGGEGGAGM